MEVNRAENEEISTAERPSETPPVTYTPTKEKVFFGRRVIKSSLTKKELSAKKIQEILPQVLREHAKNAREIDYLYNYYKGKQPILRKEKVVRPEINNVVLENHAFEIVEFKKAYVYGEPVQYVQKGEKKNETINPEISELNKFMESEDKSSQDKELAEWQYICGTAYRWADFDNSEDEDEAPFELSVPDPRNTFVVYSSGIQQEPLFCGHYSYFSDRIQSEDGYETISKYRIITIYTDTFMCQFKEAFGTCDLLDFELPVNEEETVKVKEYPLVVKGQRIVEYPLNQARLGLVELVMTQLNALNRIKSDDLDGIDQFVQSLLVFVNQEIDLPTFKTLVANGAIQVATSDPRKTSRRKTINISIVT